MSRPGLKMSELAERSGVSVGTIKHYLREGLLDDGGEVVRTSRNMAWYPPAFVERIRLIKRLQEERFMPLKVIRELLEREGGDPEAVRSLLAESDRGIERALARERERTPAAEVSERFAVPLEVLERLAEVGILSSAAEGYTPADVRIVEAIARFRAGGYDERIGFTVYDAARFLEPLQALARREVELLSEKLVGRFEPDRAADLIAAGIDPLADLIAAMNAKLITAEIESHRANPR